MAQRQDKMPKSPYRKLRVSQVNRNDLFVPTKSVPSIRLTGKWLTECGFSIGQPFYVRESPGRIELWVNTGDDMGDTPGD